jgi:hypothetical protein
VAVITNSGPVGTIFNFEIRYGSPAAAVSAESIVVVNERGTTRPGQLTMSQTRVSIVWNYDSISGGACTCTVHFLSAGRSIASATFTVTLPTTAQARANLLREIDAYDREVYQRYAPASPKTGDWRPLSLKLETWTLLHPIFAQYYSWHLATYGGGAFWYIFFHPRSMPDTVDAYLSQRR